MSLNPTEVSGFQKRDAGYQGNGTGPEMYTVALGGTLREAEK